MRAAGQRAPLRAGSPSTNRHQVLPNNATPYRPRILVVEDDRSTGEGLSRALEREGYEVQWAQDGTSALTVASQTPPDLVVLDLYLPDVDGVDVCQELRERLPSVLIVILTARSDEIDVVVGLDAGADDYLVKPFRLAELLARLRAQLRRALPSRASEQVVVGDLRLQPGARRVFVGPKVEVVLRPKEFDLLLLLASEAGHAVSRERIMKAVWNVDLPSSSKTLDMHVSWLRHKLAGAGCASRITTLRGAGYRLDP